MGAAGTQGRGGAGTMSMPSAAYAPGHPAEVLSAA
jgi:hypothetical protein